MLDRKNVIMDDNEISNNKEENALTSTSNVLKTNFAVLLFYTIVFPIMDGQEGMFMVFVLSCGHGALLLITGVIMIFIDKTRSLGLALILSSFLLVGIGFSFCFGALSKGIL